MEFVDIADMVRKRIEEVKSNLIHVAGEKLGDDIEFVYAAADNHPATPSEDPVDGSRIRKPSEIEWEREENTFRVKEDSIRDAKIHEVYGAKPFLGVKNKFKSEINSLIRKII